MEDVRASLPVDVFERSTGKALAIFVPPFVLYMTSIFLLGPTRWPVGAMAVWCALNSLLIAVLFIIGHDACHASFTSSSIVNQIVGRLAMLPSLTPFTFWELGHNRLHHGFTNLKGKDYVWTPYSYEEFQSLSPFRRALEKFYRSFWGVGAYYLIEIWWRHLVMPGADERGQLPRLKAAMDRLLVAGFLVFEVLAIFQQGTNGQESVGLVVLGLLVPFLTWNLAMGMVIYLHHTHPRVRWLQQAEERGAFCDRLPDTVHVVCPRWLGALLLNILEHPAHHIAPRIPLYNLKRAQHFLATAFPSQVITHDVSLASIRQVMAACRLYDYQCGQWLDWSGKPSLFLDGKSAGPDALVKTSCAMN
ncbi:MAG: Delta(12)-fatty-acid desaturase [Nitrospira sp.]|nr:MAG: Delta(12)-fatty-acid desaturase [Nitrospira sp.]